MTGTPLRCCAGCGGSFLGDDRRGKWFCPKCAAKLPKHDPQPHAVGLRNQSIVSLTAPSNYSGWCVLARDGDTLTLRPLGNPDDEPIKVHVNNTKPYDAFGG